MCGSPERGDADIVYTASGLSNKNVSVKLQATFTISGDSLTIVVENLSPVNSLNPDDVLGSVYFDSVDGGGSRPTLTYRSATGDVYSTLNPGNDTLFAAGADLRALGTTEAQGFDKWQFKTFDPSVDPLTGFGIGTVGNNSLTPNGFNGNIAGGIDYGLYRNEVTTNNLRNRKLVKNIMTVGFSGVSGWTESQIDRVVFGLGTAPDSVMTASVVPEPRTWLLMAVTLGGMIRWRRRRAIARTA